MALGQLGWASVAHGLFCRCGLTAGGLDEPFQSAVGAGAGIDEAADATTVLLRQNQDEKRPVPR